MEKIYLLGTSLAGIVLLVLGTLIFLYYRELWPFAAEAKHGSSKSSQLFGSKSDEMANDGFGGSSNLKGESNIWGWNKNE